MLAVKRIALFAVAISLVAVPAAPAPAQSGGEEGARSGPPAGLYRFVPEESEPIAEEIDRACMALITDLKQRGMLDDTLIVWAGEFGRTPMSQGMDGEGGKIMHGSHGAGECRLIPEARMKTYRRPEKQLERVDGGHVVSGRFRFGSGLPHATVVTALVLAACTTAS